MALNDSGRRPLLQARACHAPAVAAAGIALVGAVSSSGSTARQQRHRGKVAMRAWTKSIPTEYYSLLGLPMFTDDRKEIRAAHRRVVKLCHPDVLGADAVGDLLLVVTEAYDTLSDPDKRQEYDEMLKTAKPTLATSVWGDHVSPGTTRGAFVDEALCNKCYKCVEIASSTFDVHPRDDTARKEKAFVATQYGDTEEIVLLAARSCPSNAIRFLSRDDLSLYEYAMGKTCELNERIEAMGGKPTTIQEVLLDYQIDQLLAIDVEQALEDATNPMKEVEISEELSDHAKAIRDAAETVPEEVRARMWPETGVKRSLGEKTLSGEDSGDKKKSKTAEPEPKAATEDDPAYRAAFQRAKLKSMVFELYDEDEDGYLFEGELRGFASSIGFEGGDADWIAQYRMICAELNSIPARGINMIEFSRMVDNEDLCYMSDEDLVECLNESNRLPRANS